jgi:hypothetical protein
MIFNKGTKTIPWRKDSFFNKGCWGNWISTCRRLKLDPCFSKINSKSIKDLNAKLETTRRMQRGSLQDLGIGKIFLDQTLIT